MVRMRSAEEGVSERECDAMAHRDFAYEGFRLERPTRGCDHCSARLLVRRQNTLYERGDPTSARGADRATTSDALR